MSRIGLWLGAAAFAAAGLVAAAFAVDAITGEPALPEVPPVADDGSPLVVTSPGAVLAVLQEARAGLTSIEPIPLDTEVADEPPSGSGVLVPVDDPTTGGGVEVGAATGIGGEEEVAYPWEVEATGLAPEPPSPFSGAGFGGRFLDSCAEGATECPFGVGGTVLPPGGSVGEFYLYGVSSLPENWWQCHPVLVGDGAFPVMVLGNKPARMEITYFRVGFPTEPHSVQVDLTDTEGLAYREFQAAVARGEWPPVDGVQHCWVLRAQVGASRYQVDVRATSYDGERSTWSEVVEVGGDRPPVSIAARSESELLITVPVTRKPQQRSLVRVLYRSQGLSCGDIEAETLAGESGVVEGPSFGGFRYREDVTELIGTYDPDYEAREYWSVNLQEGYGYLVCVWWLSTPGGGTTFNPDSFEVDEREQRRVVAPDRYRVQVTTLGFTAGGLTILPGNYRVDMPDACRYRTPNIPDTSIELHPGARPMDADDSYVIVNVVCDLAGVSRPDSVLLTIHAPSGSERSIAIPTRAAPRCDAPGSEVDDSLLFVDQDLCRLYVLRIDGNLIEFWVQYRRGEDVTNEVTLSGFADCNSVGVISLHESGTLDRGTPSGGCGSWLIGDPVPFP